MPDVSSKYSLYEFEVYPALAPSLSIALSGTNVVITWPTSATSWPLQTAPVLGLPGNWNNLTTAPLFLNSAYVVTNSVGSTEQCYRFEQNPWR